jgi:hypothetical protein
MTRAHEAFIQIKLNLSQLECSVHTQQSKLRKSIANNYQIERGAELKPKTLFRRAATKRFSLISAGERAECAQSPLRDSAQCA